MVRVDCVGRDAHHRSGSSPAAPRSGSLLGGDSVIEVVAGEAAARDVDADLMALCVYVERQKSVYVCKTTGKLIMRAEEKVPCAMQE